MNRRTFIKTLSAVAAVSLTFVGKAVFALPQTRKGYRELKPEERPRHAFFAGRRFLAYGRRIQWSRIGEHEIWPEANFVDLPSTDVCDDLINSESYLIWLGCSEVWRIRQTFSNFNPFEWESLGYREDAVFDSGRQIIGWRPIKNN